MEKVFYSTVEIYVLAKATKHTKGRGTMMLCMVMVFISGEMAVGMKAGMSTIRSMGLASTLGPMGDNTTASGWMEGSMARVSTYRVTANVEKGYGKKVNVYSGLVLKRPAQ